MTQLKKVSSRELRRVLDQGVVPAVQQLLHNEGVAREKIDALEQKASALDAWMAAKANRWERFRWLLTGK